MRFSSTSNAAPRPQSRTIKHPVTQRDAAAVPRGPIARRKMVAPLARSLGTHAAVSDYADTDVRETSRRLIPVRRAVG